MDIIIRYNERFINEGSQGNGYTLRKLLSIIDRLIWISYYSTLCSTANSKYVFLETSSNIAFLLYHLFSLHFRNILYSYSSLRKYKKYTIDKLYDRSTVRSFRGYQDTMQEDKSFIYPKSRVLKKAAELRQNRSHETFTHRTSFHKLLGTIRTMANVQSYDRQYIVPWDSSHNHHYALIIKKGKCFYSLPQSTVPR